MNRTHFQKLLSVILISLGVILLFISANYPFTGFVLLILGFGLFIGLGHSPIKWFSLNPLPAGSNPEKEGGSDTTWGNNSGDGCDGGGGD